MSDNTMEPRLLYMWTICWARGNYDYTRLKTIPISHHWAQIPTDNTTYNE